MEVLPVEAPHLHDHDQESALIDDAMTSCEIRAVLKDSSLATADRAAEDALAGNRLVKASTTTVSISTEALKSEEPHNQATVRIDELNAPSSVSDTSAEDKEKSAPPKDPTDPPEISEQKPQDALSKENDSGELKKQLTALMDRLEKLEKDAAASLDAETKHASHADIQPGVRRLTMEYWKPLNHKGEESLTHDIIVYYDEILPDNDAIAEEVKLRYKGPRRVQINSHELRDELAAIIGSSMSNCPTCFVYPFRPLILFHSDIERAIAKRRELLKIAEAPFIATSTPEFPELAPPATSKASAEDKKLLTSMEALLEFTVVEMKDELELRQRIRNCEVSTIAHHNLWHLFEPGKLIFRKEKRNNKEDVLRLYRVHHVSGGRPRLGPQATSQMFHNSEFSEVSKKQDNLSGGSVQQNPRPIDTDLNTDDQLSLALGCHNFMFDGFNVGAEEHKFLIKGYRGEKPIKDLKIFPVHYADGWSDTIESLKDRGKRVQSMIKQGAAHREHHGYTIDMEQVVSGQVMIDFQEINSDSSLNDLSVFDGVEVSTKGTYERWECGTSSCNSCTRNFNDTAMEMSIFLQWFNTHQHELTPVDPTQDELPDRYLTLLSHKVGAYSLHHRKWHQLDIDQVRDIRYSSTELKSCFNDVVMDKDNQELLLALVSQHPSGKALLDKSMDANGADVVTHQDLVKGKGQGLVILLHGPPGVGKTLTAETIAVHTRRPLYAITCGDIGQTPKDIEDNLERHFKLAHKWGCVLLLDEADVFLAERTPGDVKRNAMVSVFLRTLEYYSGILFLTTNQVGQLDEAFKSRIGIQLHYPKFDRKSTLKLWRNHLRRLEERNQDIDQQKKESAEPAKAPRVKVTFDQDDLVDFALEHYVTNSELNLAWNGRQIRNAFQTATALAEYDRVQKIKKRVDASKGKKTEEEVRAKHYKSIELKREHFQKVARTAKTFEDYMKSVKKNRTGAEEAHYKGYRNDDFDEDVPQTQKFRGLKKSKTFDDTPSQTPTTKRRKSTVVQPLLKKKPVSPPESAAEEAMNSELTEQSSAVENEELSESESE